MGREGGGGFRMGNTCIPEYNKKKIKINKLKKKHEKKKKMIIKLSKISSLKIKHFDRR